jgi:hypothetical protein
VAVRPPRQLLVEDLPDMAVRRLTRGNMVGHCGYAAALALTFVSPPARLAVCGIVALYYVHPGRGPIDAFGPQAS